MGSNKTEKAIQRASKAAGGVRQIVDKFEEEASIRRKSPSHSPKSSIGRELSIIEPFKKIPGRSHNSLMDIESNPLHSLDEDKFGAWLKRHQRLHFPTAELESMDEDIGEEFDEEF